MNFLNKEYKRNISHKNRGMKLENLINEVGPKTRDAVVAAALYLAELDYNIPYTWGGKYTKVGLDPKWGTIVDVVKSLIGKAPILAIGLGHEVLSLAMGGKIEKSGTCHRGANIPVLHIESGRTFITNQNHGYYVCSDSVPNNATVTFTNSNDKSIEGINYKKEMCISVQFYPDTEKASHTTAFIYDDFCKMMGGKHNA